MDDVRQRGGEWTAADAAAAAATGNNIFLLETIVHRVRLADPVEANSTCPLCVCFRFPGLVEMDVCEGDYCTDAANGTRRPVGDETLIMRGKSCLFAVGAADLCRTARNFCAAISVYRRVAGVPETRLVAQTRLDFDLSFTELLLDPDQEDRSRELKRAVALYESGQSNSIGVLEVQVRLTSHGDLLITHFDRSENSNNYQYKGLNQYVPTNACVSEKCLDEKKMKKCCKKRKNKYHKNEIEKLPNPDDCNKQIDQVNCILTMMELMKDMFTQSMMTSTPLQMQRQDSDEPVAGGKPKQCVFDPDCPVVSCPFRTDEPLNAYVEQLIESGGHVGTTRQRPGNCEEIVDDADLFALKVGRVDPCRTNPPVHRNKCTQYAESDLPPEFLPPPPPPPPTADKSKSKKSKKNKKKKGKNKKK